MKNDTELKVVSLLSLLLLTVHVTDDIVRGISKAEPANTALIVLAILVYGALALTRRLSGYIITLIIGIFAMLMPVMHFRGTHYPDLAASAGGFFFVWVLWALGGIGGGTIILSVQGLLSLRKKQPA